MDPINFFIECHIDLIDQNKFAELYNEATDKWRFPNNRNISRLTETLLKAGVNPLEYMDYVPLYMFWESELTKIELPETITFIENDAFNGSHFTEITIPASCDSIGPNAFSYSQISRVRILNPNCALDKEVFMDSYGPQTSNLKCIIYNGTIKQFREKYKDINLPRKFILQANDGNTFMEQY